MATIEICESCGAHKGQGQACLDCRDWRAWERIERQECHAALEVAQHEPRPLREGEDDHGE